MYHGQGNTDYQHPCLAMMQTSTREQTWNHGGTIPMCSWELSSIFPGTTTCARKLKEQIFGTIYNFQEEDAADGISSAPSDQGRSARQLLSSKTSQLQ